MIGSRLYRRQFVIAAVSVFACVALGTLALTLLVRLIMPAPEPRRIQTPTFFYTFVEGEFGGDLVRAMGKLERYMEGDPMRFFLLDERGGVLYPPGGAAPRVTNFPKAAHETEPASPPRPGEPMVSITRLNHEPARFLVGVMEGGPGPHPPGRPPGPPPGPPGFPGHLFFPASFLTLGLMVLLGIAVGLAIIFRSLRAAGAEADEVISELKRGNLKARFPVERNDEIGAAMRRFNAMADEIEKLVERLRLAENSRNNLLQELTHDLRTPVASLRALLEGIFRNVPMGEEARELSTLAEKEVEYLGKLVEDLLLLAQLTEPRFRAAKGYVDLLSLLEQESDAVSRKRDGQVAVRAEFRVDEALVQGDEHLFERLVRNALENAVTYAKSRVEVEVRDAGNGAIGVRIRDDGAGFSAESLARFGERRDQRRTQPAADGKLSLGLGSVIMKSVVSLHGGTLTARNAPEGGAVVEFVLPRGA